MYDSEKLIGTMRLRQSQSSKEPFYISQEFELNGFEKKLLKHNFLEIGRLCTKKGSNFYSPYKLLSAEFKYAKARNIENFIGCTSFYLKNPQDAEDIFLILEKQGKTISRDNLINVKEDYKMNFNPQTIKNENTPIPSLAKLYFRVGAKIISESAIDRDFKKRDTNLSCIDYLMAGNVKNIPSDIESNFYHASKDLIIDEKIFKKTLNPLWKNKKIIFIMPQINPLLNPLSKINNKIKERKFQKRFELLRA